MKNIILLIAFLLGFSGLAKSQTFEHFRVEDTDDTFVYLFPKFDSRGDTSVYNSYYRIKEQDVFWSFSKTTLKQAMSVDTRAKLKDNDRIRFQIYFDKTGKMFYGNFLVSRELLSKFSDEELLKIYKAFQERPLDMNNYDLRQPDESKAFKFGILHIAISQKAFH